VELREYLEVLRRRWLLVLLPVVVAAVAGGLLAAEHPRYTSTAILYAQPSQGTSVGSTSLAEQRLHSVAELAKQRRLARAVDDRLHLPGTARDVQDMVSTRTQADALLLYVDVKDSQPTRARRVADATAQSLMSLSDSLELKGDSAAAQPPVRLRVAQHATDPASHVLTDVSRRTGFAGLLGLVAGVVLALLRETYDESVRTASHLSQAAGTNSVSVLPYERSLHTNRADAVVEDLDNAWTESLHRTLLRLSPPSRPMSRTSLVVTGCAAGVGATTMSCGLALAAAQTGLSVLLIGADTRVSRLDEHLGVRDVVGLSDVLLREHPIDEAVRSWGAHGLQVMLPGSAEASSGDLMRALRTSELLAELERRYDLVIIDAPPLLSVTESTALGSAAGGILLVARHQHTRTTRVREAADLCAEIGTPVLSAVLAMAPRDRRVFGRPRRVPGRPGTIRSRLSALVSAPGGGGAAPPAAGPDGHHPGAAPAGGHAPGFAETQNRDSAGEPRAEDQHVLQAAETVRGGGRAGE